MEASGTSRVSPGFTSVAEGGSSPVTRHRASTVRASNFRSRRFSLRRRLGSAPEGAGEGGAAVEGSGGRGWLRGGGCGAAGEDVLPVLEDGPVEFESPITHLM